MFIQKESKLYCLIAAFILFLFSIEVNQWDWHIAQSQANIIFHSLGHFESISFPFFSFKTGFGYYFIQDPQAKIYSIDLITVPILGPYYGIRASLFIISFAFTLLNINFFKIFFSNKTSVILSISFTLSSGILWRIYIGNDMFIWNLSAPIFLFLLFNFINDPNNKNSINLSLLTILIFFAPSFHALVYLIIPISIIFITFYYDLLIYNFRKIVKFTVLYVPIILLGISIKLFSFYLFSHFLSRHLDFDNTIPLVDALKGLLNFFYTTRDVVLLNQPTSDLGWGSEEVSVALNPIISFFAVFSIVLFFFNKNTSSQIKLFILSLILIIIGLLLSCNETIWLYIKYITSNSIRVSSRFLSLSQFGILLLSGYSIDYFIKSSRDYYFRLVIGLIFLFSGIFTLEILNSNTNFYKDRSNAKYEFQNKIQCFDRDHYLQDSDLVVSNFYHVVGNKQHIDCTEGLIDKRLRIGNSEIEISILNPMEQIFIPFDFPFFDFIPQKTEDLKLFKMDHGFIAENFSGKILKKIKLKVYFPIPLIVILLNFFTIFILLIFAFYPIDRKKN